MRTAEERLKVCPMCHRDVKNIDLGMRDFRWLGSALPGRVGAADIDAVIEQHSTGRVLVLEFKRKGEPLPVGQRLLLQTFARHFDVWVAWEDTPAATVDVSTLVEDGQLYQMGTFSKEQFAAKIGAWWDEGGRA